MPQVILYIAVSVDGYIADAEGDVGWLPSGDANSSGDGDAGGGDDFGYGAFYGGVDALVMGRRTYDQVLGFGEWPYPGKAVYVFTGRPPGNGGSGSSAGDSNGNGDGGAPDGVAFVGGEVGDFVRRVAGRYDDGGAVWLVGGANLAEQFRRAGLIDEYRIFVIPVILGRGIPLFDGGAPGGSVPGDDGEAASDLTALRLVAAQTYAGGIVELRYHPAAASGQPQQG